jgi:hypothetical protein
MEAVSFSETKVIIYQTVWHNIQKTAILIYIFSTLNNNLNLKRARLRYCWLSSMYFSLPNIVNPYIQ